MRIKMLQTSFGASDGVTVRPYQAGETYDVSQTLADAFLGDRVAALADQPAKPKAKPKATKNAGAQPENKAG